MDTNETLEPVEEVAETTDTPEAESTAVLDNTDDTKTDDVSPADDYIDDFDDFDDFTEGPEPSETSDSTDTDEKTTNPETADVSSKQNEPKPNKLKTGLRKVKTKTVSITNDSIEKLKKLPWKQIGTYSGAAAGICALIYFGGVLFYNSHFYYKTALGSFDCSNLNVKQAEEKIKNELGNYKFLIHERGDKTESIDCKNIDFVCKSISGVSDALKKQNPFKWPFDKAARIQKVDIDVDFDEDKLYHEAEKLDCFAVSIRDMDGAYAGVYYEDGSYHMREVEDKNAISFERLYSSLVAGIKGTYKDMSLEEEGIYVLMADEDNMRHALEKMNSYVSTKVTYTRGDETFELNGDTINAWLTINPDYTITIDDNGIAEYVSELSKLYNTIGIDRSFKTSYGDTITVNGGDYGWEIDKQKEAATLKENITNGEVISRNPECKHKEVGDGNAKVISKTYVEASISAQQLWFYKNGELIISTPMVSGNVLKGNGTHKGVYSLKYKEKDAVLKGDDYETPVSFWMPFNGGEGMHDATWRGAFGGSIYRGGGSHGCLNLPYNAAATIFANIDPGTPVVVF